MRNGAVVFQEAKLEPYFVLQPILPTRRDLPRGAEALLRLRDRNGTDSPLDRFLVNAALGRRLEEIDEYMLSTVIEWLESVKGFPLPDDFVAINIDADSFVDPRCMKFLLDQILKTSYISHLCLEITETAHLEDFKTAKAHMATLQGIGVRIALDDFGSGYMGLTALKHLHADFVKIDGQLLKNVDRDQRTRNVVSYLIELSHDLGALTIAEHIETPSEAQQLIELGADYLQGYLLSKAKIPGQTAPFLGCYPQSEHATLDCEDHHCAAA